jgi:CheY-like chemotaxis protein
LEISVIDTGVGISSEDQKKLFKLFGFIETSQEMNTHGIGLGLVIAENIVQEFGGKISVKSEPDVGSIFTFQFVLNDMQDFEEEA